MDTEGTPEQTQHEDLEEQESFTSEEDEGIETFNYNTSNQFNSFVGNKDRSGIPSYMKKLGTLDSISGNSEDIQSQQLE